MMQSSTFGQTFAAADEATEARVLVLSQAVDQTVHETQGWQAAHAAAAEQTVHALTDLQHRLGTLEEAAAHHVVAVAVPSSL
jgi:hypothetical protein